MKKGLVFLLCAVAALGAHADIKGLPRFALPKANLKHHVRSSSECIVRECVDEGKQCNASTSVCVGDSYCLGGVCRGPQVDDECRWSDECGSDLYCKDNKCAERLGEGATCTGEDENECAEGLECDSTSKKCTKPVLAKKGEKCDSTTTCASGLYCKTETGKLEGVCTEVIAAGKECDPSYLLSCEDGYLCLQVDSKAICRPLLAKKDDYCTILIPYCIPGYKCVNDKCVEGGETCDSESKDPYKHMCLNKKCVEFGSLAKGEECYPSNKTADAEDLMESSILCSDGLGCIPNADGTKYTCEKITTKLEDKKTCSDENPCPSDSFCDCNDETGVTMCIPYASTTSKINDEYKKILKDMYGCYEKDSYTKMAECGEKISTDVENFQITYLKKFFGYSAEYRCASETGAASSIKATFAFVFSILAIIFLF